MKRGRSSRIERAVGPFADQDVELEVLHGRVEDLFDGPGQTVDLVDEQDVAVLQVGEQRGQVARPHQRRAGGDAQPDAHLRRHDAGERGLAQTRGPGEQQVVDGLFAAPRRLEHDLEMLGQLRLPVELGQAPGPETGLVGELGRVGQGVHRPRRGAVGPRGCAGASHALDVRRVVSRRQHLAPPVHRAPASSRNAWRSNSSTVPSLSPPSSARRISSGP